MTPSEIKNKLHEIFINTARDNICTYGTYTGGDFSEALDDIAANESTLLKEYLEYNYISDDTKAMIKDAVVNDVEAGVIYHIKEDCIEIYNTTLADIEEICSDGHKDCDDVYNSIDRFFEELENNLEDYIDSLSDDIDIDAVKLLYEMEEK